MNHSGPQLQPRRPWPEQDIDTREGPPVRRRYFDEELALEREYRDWRIANRYAPTVDRENLLARWTRMAMAHVGGQFLKAWQRRCRRCAVDAAA